MTTYIAVRIYVGYFPLPEVYLMCTMLWKLSSRAIPLQFHIQYSINGSTMVTDLMNMTEDVMYCTVLYCTVLYCTVLYCAVLCCAVLCCTVLYSTVQYSTVLYSTVLYSTVLCS